MNRNGKQKSQLPDGLNIEFLFFRAPCLGASQDLFGEH